MHPKSPTTRALLLLTTALVAASLAVSGAYAVTSGGPRQVDAHASGVESLNELMSMQVTSVKGKRIAARGTSSGTIAGSVSVNLVLTSASRASALFSGSNSRGSVSASGTASYHVAGPISYYTGTVTGIKGSGRYAHAYSLGLTFTGTLNRRTYQVSFRLRGKWHV